MKEVFKKISKFFILILIFLLPTFILPLTPEIFEFNKAYLLVFLTFFSLFFYLLYFSFSEEIVIRFSRLWLPVFIFIFSAFLSTFFSLDRYVSFFGFYPRFSDGFLILIFLFIFSFLLFQLFENLKIISRVLLLSVSISLLVYYLSTFNLLGKIRFFQVFSFPGFNLTSSSILGFSVFLSIIFVFSLSFLISFSHPFFEKVFIFLFIIFNILAIFLTGYKLPILNLFFSIFFLLFLSIFFRVFKEEVEKLFLPTFFLLIVSFFLIFPFPFRVLGPIEVTLGQKFSWQVAFSSLISSLKNFFLGSGLATFYHDFVRFKSPSFNQTNFWNLRFDKPQSYVSGLLAETGILGFVSFISIALLIFYCIFVLRERKEAIPYLSSFFSTIFASILYYQNISLGFIFWLFLALAILSFKSLIFEKKISFSNFPEIRVILFALSTFVFTCLLISLFVGVRNYQAEIQIKKYIRSLGEERRELIRKAIQLNPRQTVYYIFLAQDDLNLLLFEIQKIDRDMSKIQNLISEAISSAQIATQLSPNYVFAWETLGLVYREIQSLAGGASEWALKSFEKARDLDPKNPVLYTEIGKIHLRLGNLEAAKKNFEFAEKYRSDYWDLNFQKALLLEKEGKIEEAIAKLQELERTLPLIEIKFELGRIYFNSKEYDLALSKFEEVLSVFPNHSNSLYSAALVYEQKGNKAKAIEYLEKVLQLNPGQEEIIKKIEALKTQTALPPSKK